RNFHGSPRSTPSARAVRGRAATTLATRKIPKLLKLPSFRCPTACAPSLSFNSRTSSVTVGQNPRTHRSATPLTHGMTVATRDFKSASRAAIAYYVSKASAGPAARSVSNQAVDGLRVSYSLHVDGDIHVLDDLQWADWDQDGRLLVATRTGRLQVRKIDDDGFQTLFEEDLSLLDPSAAPAPAWAQRW